MTEGFALHEIISTEAGRPVDYRLIAVNPAFERLTGLKREDVLGKPIRESLPGNNPRWDEAFQQVARTGEGVHIEAFAPPLNRWYGAFVYRSSARQFAVIFTDITARKQAEEALRVANERLALAQRCAGAGVWDWDFATGKLHWSPQLFELFGLDPSSMDATFETWHSVVHPDDRRKADEQIEDAVRNHTSLASEYRVVLPSGQTRWISALGNVSSDEHGQPQRMSGICLDITQRRAAEESLKQSKHEYQSLAENLPSMVYRVYLLEDNRMQFFNRQVQPMTGYRVDELTGGAVCQIEPLIVEEDRARVRDTVLEATRNREPFEVTYRLRRKDGEVRNFSERGRPVEGPDGQLCYIDGVIVDVTHHQQVEEALRQTRDELEQLVRERTARGNLAEAALIESQRDYAAMFEASSVGKAQANPATRRFTRVNQAMAQITGYSVDELCRMDFADLTHPDDRQRDAEVTTPVLKGNADRWQIEKRYVRKNGDVIWVNVAANLIRDPDGKPSRTIAVIQDITERKRAEAELERTNRMLHVLGECNEAVIRIDDEQQLMQEVCRIAVEVGGFRMAWVGLAQHDQEKSVRPVACAGFDDGYLESARISWADDEQGSGPTGNAIRTGQLQLGSDFLTDPHLAPWRQEAAKRGYRCSISLPLRQDHAVIGALTIYGAESAVFDDAQSKVLRELADDLSLGLNALRLRAALREQSKILDAYFQYSVTPLVLLDRDFNFIRVNQAYAEACGKETADFPGRNHFEFYPQADNEAIFQSVVKSRTPYVAKAKAFTFPDDPERGVSYWDWILTPLLDETGEVEFLVFALEEVTSRVLAEKGLRAANEQLSSRAAQLRALAGELTLTEQRERGRLARVLHDHLQQILVAAKFRMSILGRTTDEVVRAGVKEVESLLDESISASRSLTAELSPPILHQGGLPDGLKWLARWMADKHGLFVELSAQKDASPQAEDAKVLLFEAVRELLFNAVKHSGTKSASVSLRRLKDDRVHIVVADEGRGFDPQALKPVGSTGRGFGLFSIGERLSMIGGHFEVDSAPGEGSRFTITAPIGKSAAPAAPPVEPSPATPPTEEAAPAPAPIPGAKIRVMLADDHAVMRQGLALLLSNVPDIDIVGEAADGQDAIEVAG